MNTTTLISNAANIFTVIIGVAFFAVTTVGIAAPVHASTTVTTTAAR